MVDKTPNHGLNRYERGESNWTHAPDMETIERRLTVRDSETNRDDYLPHADAIFVATDTGAVFRGTGDRWEPATRQFDAIRTESASIADDNNEINVRGIDGETLSERIEEAFSIIEGGGIIRIPRPQGGGIWEWGETLYVDTNEFEGIALRFDYGVEVVYEGDSWVFDIDGRESSQSQTFSLVGRSAEFVAENDPRGFMRATDTSNIRCIIDTRNFENEDGECTAVLLRNEDEWTEGWYLGGHHRACDRGVDFEPAAMTGGDGTGSFADGRTDDLAISFNDFGLRARGNHRAQHDNIQLFPRDNGAIGLVFDGDLGNTVFVSPRFDDTNGVEDIGIVTGSDFVRQRSPYLVNPWFSDISIEIIRTDEKDDVWAMRGDIGGKIALQNLGRGSITVSRTGSLRLLDDDGNENVVISSSGHVETMRHFNTRPRFVERFGWSAEDLTETAPDSRDVAWHDGSGGHSEGLCFEADGSWYNVRDQETF